MVAKTPVEKPQTIMLRQGGDSNNNNKGGRRWAEEIESLVLFNKCSHPPRHLVMIKTSVRSEGKVMIQVTDEVR